MIRLRSGGNKLLAALPLLLLVLISSCNDANTPEAVAKNYLKAISRGDYDKARAYVTKDSKPVLDHFSEAYPHVGVGQKFVVLENSVQQNDTATTIAYRWEGMEEGLLVLENQDGNWRVQLDFLEGINPAMMREAVEEMLRTIYEEVDVPEHNSLEDDLDGENKTE